MYTPAEYLGELALPSQLATGSAITILPFKPEYASNAVKDLVYGSGKRVGYEPVIATVERRVLPRNDGKVVLPSGLQLNWKILAGLGILGAAGYFAFLR